MLTKESGGLQEQSQEDWVVAGVYFLFPPLNTTSTTIKPAVTLAEAASLPVVCNPQSQREIVPDVQVVSPW